MPAPTRHATAQAVYSQYHLTPRDVVARNTGIGIPASMYRERIERERFILDGDNALAEKLAFNGLDVFQGRRLTWVGDVTGRAINLSALRDVNIFESVQQRHRGKYLKALEHFGQGHRGRKHFRYLVVTSQRRLAVGEDLKGLKESMTRRLSKWQREIRTMFGIELLLNVIEFTFDKEKRTVFVHFNLLVWPHRALGRAIGKQIKDGHEVTMTEWDAFLKYTWKFLKVHWQDNGRVDDFKELIKYMLKSVDRMNLSQVEAVWLYNELFHQRFIIPYNSFREHLAQLKRDRQKLVYVAEPSGGKALRVIQLPDLDTTPRDEDEDETEDTGVKETENLIRGRTAPLVRVSAWAEPGTLIEGYTPTPETGGGRRRLEEARERAAGALEHWRANGAPDPATALAVSDAWLLAASHDDAAQIVAMGGGAGNEKENRARTSSRRPANDEGAPSRVHTTDLSLPSTGPGMTAAPPQNTAPGLFRSALRQAPPEKRGARIRFLRNVVDERDNDAFGSGILRRGDGGNFHR